MAPMPDTIVPAVLDHKRLHLRCTAVLERLRVESRASGDASSVMTQGCAAVTEAKQIAVVAGANWSERCPAPVA
jgi:hypothetical protein